MVLKEKEEEGKRNFKKRRTKEKEKGDKEEKS